MIPTKTNAAEININAEETLAEAHPTTAADHLPAKMETHVHVQVWCLLQPSCTQKARPTRRTKSVGTVHELLAERELVGRLAVGDLVGAEPLADGVEEPCERGKR